MLSFLNFKRMEGDSMPHYSEKDIESYLREKIKELGGKAYKWVSPGNAGVPDRLVCLRGKMIPVELKAPSKKPTELQLKKHQELNKLGVTVYVIDSKEKVDEFLRGLKQ